MTNENTYRDDNMSYIYKKENECYWWGIMGTLFTFNTARLIEWVFPDNYMQSLCFQ